jgi:hypothetical protein
MNERIQKLAREAALAESWGPGVWQTTFTEKFAELIVKECTEQIKTHGISASSEDYGDYEIGFNAGLFHALRTTKEHFGVEE